MIARLTYTLGRFFRLEAAFFRNCLTRDLQYRGNFILVFFMDIVWYLVNLAFFKVIYLNTQSIGGFTEAEVFFFLGTVFVIDALDMSFFASGLWVLGDHIRKGDFDIVLTKPVSPMLYASMRYISVGSLLDLVFALCILATAWWQLGYPVTLVSLGAYLILMLCGLAVMYSFQVAFAAVGFIFVNASSGLQMGFHHLYQFAMKPETIYKGALRFALFFVVPVLTISALSPRMILRGFDIYSFALGITTAAVMLFLSTKFFYWALRRYESASS
ncbi:MAG: ABC-2 family transporter protein [Rhizobacter sp.]|nr:ABC-2 family transporter protein [Chlorobiales bacterium]